MKLNRVLGFVAVVVLAGISARGVKADPVDPILHITDPDCASVTVWGGGPLDVTLSTDDPLECLQYTGTTPVTSMTLVFTSMPGEIYAVSDTDPADIFTNTPQFDNDDFPIVSVLLSGGEIDPSEVIGVSATCDAAHPGCLNTPFSVIVAAPETGTLLLLLVSLVPVMWFGRKFRGANSVA